MTVTGIIVIAVLAPLGLALVVGVVAWYLGKGVESADALNEEENRILVPPWIHWVYGGSPLFFLLLQKVFLEPASRMGAYPLAAAMWVMCAVGIFHYGWILKRRKGRLPFRKWAFYLLCGSVAGVMLSSWLLTW
ncbi:MAG: hypothetical protein L3J39_11180 [Verrucomicrobiales bacterium]|nr:hypothetical protein [Verrucomicrobiales bacterium]